VSATVDAQRRILRTLKAGDSVTVRDTSRSGTTYHVLGVTGDKAIEARLIGAHGARRTLVDGLHVVWMRSQTARGPRHRRVLSLSVSGRPESLLKYISRAGRKSAETEVEDLEKARWYLEREISRLRGTS
jgi:hypothetical protein